MQDCCGAPGRAVETAADALFFAWWLAGTIVLAVYVAQANSLGIRNAPARNGLVALSGASTLLFLLLLIINAVGGARKGECNNIAVANGLIANKQAVLLAPS